MNIPGLILVATIVLTTACGKQDGSSELLAVRQINRLGETASGLYPMHQGAVPSLRFYAGEYFGDFNGTDCQSTAHALLNAYRTQGITSYLGREGRRRLDSQLQFAVFGVEDTKSRTDGWVCVKVNGSSSTFITNDWRQGYADGWYDQFWQFSGTSNLIGVTFADDDAGGIVWTFRNKIDPQ
jgi:hypothetical protein